MELLCGDDYKLYNEKFSQDRYLDDYWGGSIADLNKFNITATYEILHDGESYKRLTGHRFLDLGCGPSICGLITTPDRFTNITMADLSQRNLNIIRDWINGEKVHFQWEKVFRFTAELDGAKDVPAWIENKTSHIKRSVKELVPCDVTKERPIGEEYEETFDVIFTSFCLGCAARSIAEYTGCLKNVSPLLSPGGYLVIRGALLSDAYKVGDKQFYHLALSSSDVKDALRNANFEILEYKSEHFDFNLAEGDGYGVFVLLAKKA